jgi:hypothetical protein
LNEWRSTLRALGIKLAVVSIFSFSSKAVLVLLSYVDSHALKSGGTRYFSLSSLLTEALPSIVTIGLLLHYHMNSLQHGSHSVPLIDNISLTDNNHD